MLPAYRAPRRAQHRQCKHGLRIKQFYRIGLWLFLSLKEEETLKNIFFVFPDTL
jgi:hypothetical protein